jgi:hypothetical protein
LEEEPIGIWDLFAKQSEGNTLEIRTSFFRWSIIITKSLDMGKNYKQAKTDFIDNRVKEMRSNGEADATRKATNEWRSSSERMDSMFGNVNATSPTIYESNSLDVDDVGSPDL